MHVSELPDRSQDYLKKIYDLQEWGRAGSGEAGGASLSTLAAELDQRRSTASEAVKRLVAEGLVLHAPYGDITLSEKGRLLALQMVRRHRLLETYLQRELGYGRDEVHDEAEVLEHAVSDLFISRVRHRGDVIPGKASGILRGGYYTWEDDEKHEDVSTMAR